MIKRPQRGDTEDDILQMQQEFLSERAKNPRLQPAAQFVKLGNGTKKSLFAKSREKDSNKGREKDSSMMNQVAVSSVMQKVLGEIHEKIVGDINGLSPASNRTDLLLGDIVERHVSSPKCNTTSDSKEAPGFPEVIRTPLQVKTQPRKSIFASINISKKAQILEESTLKSDESSLSETFPAEKHLSKMYGTTSVIVDDTDTAAEIHKTNLDYLSKMREDEILVEQQKLLNTIDPSLVALLKRRRLEKTNKVIPITEEPMEIDNIHQNKTKAPTNLSDLAAVISPSNVALGILKESESQNWLHFDVVESDKLEWLRDIPQQIANIEPGTNFEARFDWKGVLLPYSSTKTDSDEMSVQNFSNDERELYLHGDEPHRPGYTLQELFRLARSNVIQQRVSSFGAIAGILSIYNQGFYDNVLELPISKIFFLLRFGLDDNTPALLEVVSKALAFLFYNETDEALLDFICDNPGGQWQPILEVFKDTSDTTNSSPMENLQKQFQQLQMNALKEHAFHTKIEDDGEESYTTMSDFQLAETDLVDCLLRTNILQRIFFILNTVRPANSTVSSCLKILIRIARSKKEAAYQIVNNNHLMNCLFQNFLPELSQIDTSLRNVPFYGYPQYLCLKLLRILVTQNKVLALKLQHMGLIEKLEMYLYCRENIKDAFIKIQIESLRILRCLLLLRIDNSLYSNFLPLLCYMLEWHCNNLVYEVNGPYLLRQHASAVLMAISSGAGNGGKNSSSLEETLNKCCCSWFYRATRNGIHEFSQSTLLSTCLNGVAWCMNENGADRFKNFNSKYLREFLQSDSFQATIKSLNSTSIIARQTNDRRSVHPPLPNVGAVLIHREGPQLIIPQTYSVFLVIALWRLLTLQIEKHTGQCEILIDAVLLPQVTRNLVNYLELTATKMNRFSATNFFAKTEIQLAYKLLNCDAFKAQFERPKVLQMLYNFMCCLTAEHIQEIEHLFEQIMFNVKFQNVAEKTLKKWREIFLDTVQTHSIIVHPNEVGLSKLYTSAPILPLDWPYFCLKVTLQNYLENTQYKLADNFSDREILETTFTFIAQLEDWNPQLEIVTPTEKLMYFMIAFMGPDSDFLSQSLRPLLQEQLLHFYAKYKDHNFDFETTCIGKCKFESLYSLFVEHFQAASYGDELFGSLVLVPLAQKYDTKWRRRMWSDYAPALRYLNCEEKFLMGGLQSYLNPPEEEKSLLKAYAHALQTNLVRSNTIPHKIAEYHLKIFKEN